MLKGGPRLSAQDTTPQTTRQKKRLSFKDPEIEGPQQLYHGGCRPKGPAASNLIERQRGKGSLTLEDQAFHIAHNVGSAFSDLSLQETSTADYFDTRANSSVQIEDSKAEALINDCFLSDPSYQRNYQQQSLRISPEDQEFLEDLSPPLQIPNMRCPPIEGSEHQKRNSIPSMEEEKFPSSAQHQIQLLKYQLDQQSQQTQLAFHQIQLLTDQVGAENAARLKAQVQNNQLMMQNQELLNHIERLFQQIEELEKQVQVLERSSKIPHIQELQSTQYRTRPTYAGNRRLSSDSTSEKPSLTDHGNFSTPRRGSFATSKTNVPQQHKLATNPPAPKLATNPPPPKLATNPPPPRLAISPPPQNPPQQQQNRRSPLTTPKPYAPAIQNRLANDARGKETLHIGDTSPPVQREAATSPFGSGWNKLKQTIQPEPEKARTRTGSFSSFSKLKPPESINPKSTVLSSSSCSSAAGITSRKYSSSTSDLYSSASAYQISKPLGMEDTGASGKTAISNVNVATSKLPRFQPYTGSGRRSSLTKDFEQFSVMGKDKFKTAPQTSFFNR